MSKTLEAVAVVETNGFDVLVRCRTSLTLAVALFHVGLPVNVSSKLKSSPPLRSTSVASEMPGLLPGFTQPAPLIALTSPDPASTAPLFTCTAELVAMLPLMTSVPTGYQRGSCRGIVATQSQRGSACLDDSISSGTADDYRYRHVCRRLECGAGRAVARCPQNHILASIAFTKDSKTPRLTAASLKVNVVPDPSALAWLSWMVSAPEISGFPSKPVSPDHFMVPSENPLIVQFAVPLKISCKLEELPKALAVEPLLKTRLFAMTAPSSGFSAPPSMMVFPVPADEVPSLAVPPSRVKLPLKVLFAVNNHVPNDTVTPVAPPALSTIFQRSLPFLHCHSG